jgi:hypothetical protein
MEIVDIIISQVVVGFVVSSVLFFNVWGVSFVLHGLFDFKK